MKISRLSFVFLTVPVAVSTKSCSAPVWKLIVDFTDDPEDRYPQQETGDGDDKVIHFPLDYTDFTDYYGEPVQCSDESMSTYNPCEIDNVNGGIDNSRVVKIKFSRDAAFFGASVTYYGPASEDFPGVRIDVSTGSVDFHFG